MKGVFGMLLIGGGVILMYGMFTGHITFPFTPSGYTYTPASPTSNTGPSFLGIGQQHAPGKGPVA